MSTLEIDPPPQTLRLVSSHGTTPGDHGERPARDPRYRSAANLGGVARQLHREVLQHALRSGQAIDPDALRVVLAVRQTHHAGDICRLTAAGIWQLLFVDVLSWCRARRLPTPLGVNIAVSAIIDYLHATAGFASGSDPLHALQAAVDECTGGWDLTEQAPQRAARPGQSVRSRRGKKHP